MAQTAKKREPKLVDPDTISEIAPGIAPEIAIPSELEGESVADTLIRARQQYGQDLRSIALTEIDATATQVYKSASAGGLPDLVMPQRNLQNVTYDKKAGYFELKGNVKTRTLGETDGHDRRRYLLCAASVGAG